MKNTKTQTLDELRKQYNSPEARLVVEYVSDVWRNEYSFERVIEIIKNLADNVEYLHKETRKVYEAGREKEKHIFIAPLKEFNSFIERYQFNPNEWICIDSYEKTYGRIYKKGYVHMGYFAHQLNNLNKIIDYINCRTK